MKNFFFLAAFLMAAFGGQAQDLVNPPGMGLIPGAYVNAADENDKLTLYIKDDQLWIQSDPSNGIPECISLKFTGDNTFRSGVPPAPSTTFHFKFMDYGMVTMTKTHFPHYGQNKITVYHRITG